ncbi:MAG: Stp1/IreP family PP2C-type Ser/Thr phosphatase [Candidatus Aminicenantes bacterium]|nr:Stp1/IreP family PP2C-type Ser/Thr phosphatase [Candidatus Aminicenantes bacterium]
MKLIYAGKSDKGKLRKANEDFFACQKINDEEYLFVVADGMGGHQAGDVASKLGTETFVHRYNELRETNTPIPEALKESISRANEEILEKATADLKKRGMGTTFSAVVLADMKAHIVHVGDSRIYITRDDEIVRLTTDHTFVEKMVEEGRLTQEEARDHPQKNILYMSLGARQSFVPEVSESFNLKKGDILALCSDGLNNMVTDAQIKEYITNHPPQKAVEKLIKLANENGGIDNITLLVILVDGYKPKSSEKTEPIKIVKQRGKIASFFSKLFSEEK